MRRCESAAVLNGRYRLLGGNAFPLSGMEMLKPVMQRGELIFLLLARLRLFS